LVLAPREGRYWLTVGTSTQTGRLALAPGQRLVAADSERVTCRFAAAGSATPCAIAVRGVRDAIIRVDAWSGAIVVARSAR
jgi:hypothetical protein